MNEEDKGKMEKWEAEIKKLEEKVDEIKRGDWVVLYEANKKAVGKCFQKDDVYMKIVDSFEDELYCCEINFSNLITEYDVWFNTVEEIGEEGYLEIPLEVFDEHIKTRTQEFMRKFFEIEKQ